MPQHALPAGMLEVVVHDDSVTCRYIMRNEDLQMASIQSLHVANEWASRANSGSDPLTTAEIRDNALAIDEWNRHGVHMKKLMQTIIASLGLDEATGRTRTGQMAQHDDVDDTLCFCGDASGFDLQATSALGEVLECEEFIHATLLHAAEEMPSLHLPYALRNVCVQDRRTDRLPLNKRMRM